MYPSCLGVSAALTKPKALPIRHCGILSALVISEGSRNPSLDPSLPVPQRSIPLPRPKRDKPLNQRHQSAPYRDTACTAETDHIQGKPQKLLPGWKRDHEPQAALLLPIVPDFQMTEAELK